jgi:phosphodiesterase/alkaline phosphatase D-like protein
MKMSLHTDLNPLKPVDTKAALWLKQDDQWTKVTEVKVDTLTAMALFRVEDWSSKESTPYRVVCDSSRLEGIIRANPTDKAVLKLMAAGGVKDTFHPYEKAVEQMIAQDPDLVFFSGDQIYEKNADGKVVFAKKAKDVPKAMANYLKKWRLFGETFKDLLKDRPSIMITDDHDVYSNDLWGRGGIRRPGQRLDGGYLHPEWVNAAEKTQTWHLPDAANPGPWGSGILAYYTSLNYGGVSFAILEDRKFKSAPNQAFAMLKDGDNPRVKGKGKGKGQGDKASEVISNPAFDTSKLDHPDLQLLGKDQEEFLAQWAKKVSQTKSLAVVLTQTPYANVGNYKPDLGDMDSNGWPQSARNRALEAIVPSGAVMISGDIHYGTLLQHGIKKWGDGPWSYSTPAFGSTANRIWQPSVAPQGGAIEGIEGSGNHHDRFGNKVTMAAKADGIVGYGMILLDKKQRQITFKIYPFDEKHEPVTKTVPGWPKTIKVK